MPLSIHRPILKPSSVNPLTKQLYRTPTRTRLLNININSSLPNPNSNRQLSSKTPPSSTCCNHDQPSTSTMASEENGKDHGPSMDKVSQFLKESQDRIFVNNKAWVDSKISGDSDFFAKLSSGQKPDYLYSDLFLCLSFFPFPPFIWVLSGVLDRAEILAE